MSQYGFGGRNVLQQKKPAEIYTKNPYCKYSNLNGSTLGQNAIFCAFALLRSPFSLGLRTSPGQGENGEGPTPHGCGQTDARCG